MPDREKVIEALEACVLKDPDDSRDCRHCPRCNYGAFITTSCINGVMADALALLKAQEPEATDAPKPDSDVGCWYDITHKYTLEQVVNALKAQEAVKPKKVNRYMDIDEGGEWYTVKTYDCGGCEKELPTEAKYCPECGRKVKADG